MLERLYRLLIYLYPPKFRRRFGRQMIADYQDISWQSKSPTPAFIDLFVTVPREWLGTVRSVLRRPAAGPSPPNVLTALADQVGGEVRRASRDMIRHPAPTLVVVMTLALGLGASTAVFSWTEGVVLRPLPAVRDPSELFSIAVRAPEVSDEGSVLSYPDLVDLDEAVGGAELVGFGLGQFRLALGRDRGTSVAESAWGAFVTEDYFTALGVEPVTGRLLQPDDGSETNRLVVISEALWTARFGRDQDLAGRSLRLGEHDYRIVGVVPATFTGTIVGLTLDVWLPVGAAPDLWRQADLLSDRERRWLRVFGRVRPESGSAIHAQVSAAWQRLTDVHREGRDLEVAVVPFDIGVAARIKPLFVILLGITGFVLLAVCTNVANLLLIKGARHERQIAILIALGATRRRIATGVLTEAAVLGALGLTGGLFVARYAARLLPSLLPPSSLPLNLHAPMDARVFVFAAIVGIATVLLFGTAPALRATRAHPSDALQRRRGAIVGPGRPASALVVVQLAVSLATLVAAGFFVHRLDQLAQIDRGYSHPEDVLLFPTNLTAEDAEAAWRDARFDRLVEMVRAQPGVQAAAISTFVPLGFENYASYEVEVPGGMERSDDVPRYLVNRVGDGYFRLMGIPIHSGRPLSAVDGQTTPVSVVINESFRRTYWPTVDPVGRGLRVEGRDAIVVGVAADGKYRFDQIDEPSPPFLYLAWAQWPPASPVLHVRVDGSARGVASAVRRAFEELLPAALLQGPMSLEEYTSVALVPVRLGASVLTSLGVVAMALAALGLYAIMAFQVAQRTREVGIRTAVGAERGQIVGMFVRQGARTAVIGVAGGVPIALAIHAAFKASLSRFDSGGIIVYGGAAGLLLFVALLAATLAAGKASRIEPAIALRGE